MITLFCIRPKGFNVGNDAIFIGLKHFLDEAFGQVVNLISVPATSRYESQAKAGLTAGTVHEINQYGHGVIVGGGNLYENGELEVNLNALAALETPLMLFSLSRGRIYNRRRELVDRTDVMTDQIVLALNRKAKYSLARDRATQNYLQSIGCKHSMVAGCPTIFLDHLAERLPELHERDRAGILLSIRNPLLMNIPLERQSQVGEDIRRMIKFLKGEGHSNIRFLCHDQRDIAFAASFSGMEYIYSGDIYIYLALLRSCDLNISYRLHATLPCLSLGTPTIKISYDERALSLMDTIGMGGWNIDMVRGGDVVEEVINRYRRLNELAKLRAEVQSRWNELYANMAGAFRQFSDDVLVYRDGVTPGS
jgi:polysaccharide pyruvyl transferase WcaK-like protein